MARTYRNSDNAGYFRTPRTHGYRRDLVGAEEEIRDTLGVNYLGGNFAQINKIPTAYDDLLVNGRFEYLCREERMVEEFRKKFDLWSISHSESYTYHVQFCPYRNRFWISNKRHYLQKVDYLPMCVKIKNKVYPVNIEVHGWI